MNGLIGVYPGTFDPITNGHIDIINRSLEVCDKVIVMVAVNSKKQSLFSMEERVELIEHSFRNTNRVEVDCFQGLTVDYCVKKNAKAIIRGLRAVTDFEYEYAIALTNRKLAPNIDTVFFMASAEFSFVSSTIVKEIARHGRSAVGYVPEPVSEALLKKFKHN
ncbi:MAG: pantetheine-phosphate adenylyltransferase [Leptospiraceae bacterium]|nr:pantetheine-phosphate adenylyltransferase [Leptospiraceae bacterium]MCP5503169.1 pantetheine-phosphate adenylyltransferase [Leptospiraceae bacterium]